MWHSSCDTLPKRKEEPDMRQQARSLSRYIARHLVMALALLVATGTYASADDRTEARTHYQAGVKFYNGADYKSAIREFSAAQQLAPADLNNYNLALCYDKLGDAEPAVQYYRAYLDKVPNTDKRAEIEASVARLDAAAKSVASKKAEEARKAEAAADAKRAADDAKLAEEARRSDEAKRAAEPKKRPPPAPAPPAPPIDDKIVDPGVAAGAGAGAGLGSTGTPGTGTQATTGDTQLDRVSQIDINAIRDQRVGGAASGMADNRGGPTAAGGNGAAPPNAGAPNPAAPNQAASNANGVAPTDQPPKADPVYKKWWFWAVVAVSAYVVYSIATDNSSQPGTRGRELPLGPKMAPNDPPGGLTLMRW